MRPSQEAFKSQMGRFAGFILHDSQRFRTKWPIVSHRLMSPGLSDSASTLVQLDGADQQSGAVQIQGCGGRVLHVALNGRIHNKAGLFEGQASVI